MNRDKENYRSPKIVEFEMLPELKTDEDGNPVSGSKWVKITLE